MQKALKYFFLGALLLLLFLPAIQFYFAIPKIENTWLAGKTQDVPLEAFTAANWLDESFQKSADIHLQQTAGYRPWLVRFTNEWRFRLFKDAEADIIVGKNNCLFARPYIKSFTGQDLTDNKLLQRRVMRSKYMQQLFNSLGKQCLFIIAPGKASYMSDYIPAHYLKERKSSNNYDLLKSDFEQAGINYLDFYSYFLQQKHRSAYPLFPMYGTHWSLYGGFCAADSIIGYINSLNGQTQKPYYVKQIELSDKPHGTDKDLLDLMNIFSDLPAQQLAYPIIALTDSTARAATPRLLVIGDSYMWTLSQSGVLPAATAKSSAYWYYGNAVYDYNILPTGIEVNSLDIQQQLQNFDIVLFVFTETDMINYDFGSTENFITALQKHVNDRN
jgi:hypothetical protein